ncbi:hypothetical protein K502DRAFT_295051 [Neoconidiobolus thromboides FSU 785]|nr:hypothetical protein K502DRAFT_295051 [Neoconidiobolus thromboides FSU 785]
MGTEIPTLYLLVSGEKDNLCLSPYAWSTQLAMKHKGLNFGIILLRSNQIKKEVLKLSNGKWKQVPLVKFEDGSQAYDSRDIAYALEQKYPEAPKLFPNGKHTALFLENYFITNILTFFALLLPSEKLIFQKEDQEYAKGFFTHLGQFVKPKEEVYPELSKFLSPIGLTLKDSAFIEGDQPTYSDYIVFAFLQWFRVITPLHFKHVVENAEDKTLFKWFESILDLNNGYARSFPVNTQYGEFALN